MINLKIGPEFQSQIPPLTDDEFKQLEENILKEGKLISPLIFSPGFATVGRSKERAFEQKEKVHKHFPLPR